STPSSMASFCAVLEVLANCSKTAANSEMDNELVRDEFPDNTSLAAAPRSPCRRYAAVNATSPLPDTSATARHKRFPPICSVRSSHAGKARPERKTAASGASSGFARKYSATRRTFSVFLVVAATASQVAANSCMDTQKLYVIPGN